jgi:hypothetical protein
VQAAAEPVDVRRPAQQCEEIQEYMGQRLFHSAANGRMPTYPGADARRRAGAPEARACTRWRTSRQPLIVTHDLVDDATIPSSSTSAPATCSTPATIR